MTQLPPVALSVGADYESVASRFRPIFERIAEGAVERDQLRTLPYDQIAELKQAGFGALRVPVSHGGAGVSVKQLFRLLIELGAADSNLPQALRGHSTHPQALIATSGLHVSCAVTCLAMHGQKLATSRWAASLPK
jgi:alkylation response protein AidB-like acyl-CoA dehydrogenase